MMQMGLLQGKWRPDEEAQLVALVKEKGRKWKEIAGALGRLPEGCRDKYTELDLGEKRASGKWTDEEIARLEAAVNQYLALKQVNPNDNSCKGCLQRGCRPLIGSISAQCM